MLVFVKLLIDFAHQPLTSMCQHLNCLLSAFVFLAVSVFLVSSVQAQTNALSTSPARLQQLKQTAQTKAPNPFRLETEIKYELDKDLPVRLDVYNLLGQKVATLVDEFQLAGQQTIRWEGRDNEGRMLPGGRYVYRLVAGERAIVRALTIAE